MFAYSLLNLAPSAAITHTYLHWYLHLALIRGGRWSRLEVLRCWPTDPRSLEISTHPLCRLLDFTVQVAEALQLPDAVRPVLSFQGQRLPCGLAWMKFEE